jgi:hypothetical protein
VSLAQETGVPRSYSLVLSRIEGASRGGFGNHLIVLEIIWLANLASTKMTDIFVGAAVTWLLSWLHREMSLL